jgi:hypothetical protein
MQELEDWLHLRTPELQAGKAGAGEGRAAAIPTINAAWTSRRADRDICFLLV